MRFKVCQVAETDAGSIRDSWDLKLRRRSRAKSVYMGEETTYGRKGHGEENM